MALKVHDINAYQILTRSQDVALSVNFLVSHPAFSLPMTRLQNKQTNKTDNNKIKQLHWYEAHTFSTYKKSTIKAQSFGLFYNTRFKYVDRKNSILPTWTKGRYHQGLLNSELVKEGGSPASFCNIGCCMPVLLRRLILFELANIPL